MIFLIKKKKKKKPGLEFKQEIDVEGMKYCFHPRWAFFTHVTTELQQHPLVGPPRGLRW